MKKRLLPITLALIMLMAFIPFAPSAVATGDFTATLMGQMDTDVSESIDEWAFGDIPEATVQFNLYTPTTIKMSFSEAVKFTGNWVGLTTNVPVDDNASAAALGGLIMSVVVDGNDLGSRAVPTVDHDDGGNFAFDLARTADWGGGYDAYDFTNMDPFTSIEITFQVGHTATLMGELDEDNFGGLAHNWALGDVPAATTALKVGEENTISLTFSSPAKFTGNWTGIATSIQVVSDEDAESTGAHITSFIVDGNDLGSKLVPLINRDDNGFMTIDIARQWGGDYDAYDLAGMEPFTSLEITFEVPSMPEGEGGDAQAGADVAMEGHAWIGGTFLTDEGEFDWIPFEAQAVYFNVGEMVTVVLDFGDDKQTHGEASWGFITVVQTDIMDAAMFYDATIHDIRVDGNSISFNPANIEVGFDGGVRVSLTNGWSDDPVVADHTVIGEFSKLEVDITFLLFGDEPDTPTVEEPDPTPPPALITPPPVQETPASSGEGLPGWVIPVIIGGVVLVGAVIAIVVVKSKKKS